jgi:putative membrane protein
MFGNGGWMTEGYSGMMGGFGWLFMLAFWVGLILLIVWVVRSVVAASQTNGSSTARNILDQRYARGELTRKEYEQVKKDIGG